MAHPLFYEPSHYLPHVGQAMLDRMQTRAELYDTIGLHAFEALDASIVQTVIPQAMPQRG